MAPAKIHANLLTLENLNFILTAAFFLILSIAVLSLDIAIGKEMTEIGGFALLVFLVSTFFFTAIISQKSCITLKDRQIIITDFLNRQTRINYEDITGIQETDPVKKTPLTRRYSIYLQITHKNRKTTLIPKTNYETHWEQITRTLKEKTTK